MNNRAQMKPSQGSDLTFLPSLLKSSWVSCPATAVPWARQRHSSGASLLLWWFYCTSGILHIKYHRQMEWKARLRIHPEVMMTRRLLTGSSSRDPQLEEEPSLQAPLEKPCDRWVIMDRLTASLSRGTCGLVARLIMYRGQMTELAAAGE